VHKHKIKISEVKKLGLERTRRRWGLGWTMARKRAVQLLTTLAETRLVVRQRRMLVALCPISSNNSSYSCCSTHDGSSDFLCAPYVDGRTGNSDVEATDGGLRVAAECYKKEVGRAEEKGVITMKIAVSATNDSVDALIDPRFGRCEYFMIVDTETMNLEALPNTSRSALSGAGIQAAQAIANKGVQVVLTGNVGPNAFQTLSSAGINIITGVSGTVKDAVQKFKSGQLQKIIAPTTSMGFGMGGGYGMGMGRRGGRGMGRGVGRGYWQAAGPFSQEQISPTIDPAIRPMPPQTSKEQEVQMLENLMKNMQKQLDQIRKRLKELKE